MRFLVPATSTSATRLRERASASPVCPPDLHLESTLPSGWTRGISTRAGTLLSSRTSQEYAHPTGVIVLTPEGKIERYIFGIDYNATDLRLALLDANNRKAASPLDQVFLLCYHYDPVTGKYTPAITNVLRIAGLGTVFLLAGMVLLLSARSGNGGLFGRLNGLLSRSRANEEQNNKA